jgi:hypothetical protein
MDARHLESATLREGEELLQREDFLRHVPPVPSIHSTILCGPDWNCLALKCNDLTWQWQVSAALEGSD